uniref:DNA ligase IV n=1 Tax=Globodera rostochiensis TaxID=31243 RepID=A0A914HEM6_GLORO
MVFLRNKQYCYYERQKKNDDTFYDALRLFVPSKDERKFGMKETKLNRLVCDALMTEHLENLTSATDILVERLADKVCASLSVQTPSISIKQLNSFLDRLEFPSEKRQQEKAMSELFRCCTRMEKALGGMNSSNILRCFHKEALEAFMAGDSIRQICESFVGEEAGENVMAANGNILGKPFRPMLLKRLNFDKYCLPKIIKFCGRPFFLELKYDGEHLLVHRYNFNQYKYFTRNGIDYTHKMGSDSGAMLSGRIHPFLRPETREFVLDCELLLWDQRLQTFVGKGKRASDGKVYDSKHIDDDYIKNNSYLQRSLAIFDILYLDGSSLVDEPLVERLKKLEKLFKEEEKSTIFISQKNSVQTAQSFADFYKQSMRNGEEGIVVKAFNSVYRPGSRAERNGWFKIKPDYGVQSVLDLAVVARLPGPSSDLHLKIVAGITSRLKVLDFKRLIGLLGGSKALLEKMPEWLEKNNGNAGKNDRFVQKQNIQVVEVRASGLLNGILQFPSIVSIRNDKPISEIDTISDVLRFDERLRSRPIVDETDRHEAAVLLSRSRRQNLLLKQSHQLVRDDGTLDGTLSDALRGRKVCVLNSGSGVTTQDLQKILISLGATPISTPAAKADNYHIVHGNWLLQCRERETILPWQQSDMIHFSSRAPFDLFSLPVEPNVEQTARVIVEGEKESAEEKQEAEEVLGMEEKQEAEEVLGMEEKQEAEEVLGMEEEEGAEEVLEMEEEEGNNGAEETEMISLANKALAEEEKICDQIVHMVNSNDCAPVERGNLFSGFVFFVHESVKDEAETIRLRDKIEAQNGQITDGLDATVTHVVVASMTQDQGEALFAWNEEQKLWLGQFVTSEWVERAVLEEDRYRIGEQLHNWIRSR